jgi:hypothetical protein
MTRSGTARKSVATSVPRACWAQNAASRYKLPSAKPTAAARAVNSPAAAANKSAMSRRFTARLVLQIEVRATTIADWTRGSPPNIAFGGECSPARHPRSATSSRAFGRSLTRFRTSPLSGSRGGGRAGVVPFVALIRADARAVDLADRRPSPPSSPELVQPPGTRGGRDDDLRNHRGPNIGPR